jgi:hypothetical protein
MNPKSDALACLVDAIVRLSHCSAKWGKVWGIGVAASVAGGSLATDDWKWIARTVEWKVYLGPLMLSGWLPYHIQAGKETTY